jgi:amidase
VLGRPEAVSVSEHGLAAWLDVFRTLQGFEIWAQHGAWVREVRPTLGPGVRQRVEWASTIAAEDAAAARDRRLQIAKRMASLLTRDTVLVLPTAPHIAPLIDSDPKATEDFRTRALTLLCIAGLARLPQLNLPLATLQGCPIGVSLIGGHGADMSLLAIAKQL